MREIKFRAWDKNEKRWLEPEEFCISPSGDVFNIDADGELWGLPTVEPVRYTGLKDKNGVEIYEGDIIQEGNGTPFAVEWGETNCSCCHSVIGYLDEMDYAEVIGNIYENSELLNGDKE